jgi:hypothetical protein
VCQVLEPLTGYENYKKRQQIFMRACADLDVYEAHREGPNVLWCRYALGQYDRITYDMIDFACGFTDRWEDCADFALLPLLMIVYQEKIDAKLPPRYVERIKQAALKFKYWTDEANDTVMWMDSENHRMGFHTLEYLAGILFPQDIFVNSGQNGLFHSIKGRMHLMEWLSQRIRFGYNEFHSDSYLPVTFAPLLVIQMIAPYEEFSLRTMAKELTDITVFHLAANNFNGAIASPRGRSYNVPMRNPMQQGTTSILYVLFGRDRAAMNPTPGATAAAVCEYMPPEGICNVAYDYSEMINYYKTGFYHWGNQNANLTSMRTPEYMMSSARNHNLGRCEDHLHVAQITLPRNIIMFFSAPFTRQEGSGLRPDYWAGQFCAPEVYQYRNTLNVSWRHVTNPLIWMTHCHFEEEKFDEVVYQGQWVFGRAEDSFVGIWSENPCELAQEGNYAGRELISAGRNNNWIVECGSKREDGSFADFMNKLSAAPITVEEDKVTFVSPKNGCMEFCKEFAVEGELVPIRSMAVDSKYMKSIFGSGTYEYHMEGLEDKVWSYASSV